ncbi:13604_t:CDS:2 [Funneliformis caledonium]|uniref:13604_t:CDS:1 n=1 Tax=Funneliformis caledonium TaxID=1117310 RepID=A0A9N8Z3B0_9GLOM|nr:13604_t:CDS:2 [Funneliformis caledonium]
MAADKGSEKTSVQVALRIRPITNEDTANLPTRFQRQILTTSPHIPNQVVVQGQNDKKPQTFSFDHVFGPDTKQKEVFEKAVLNLVDKFLEGYNVTILAYGQTSSGKTHTMGTVDNSSILPDYKGIIPRAMSTLFSTINAAQYKTRKFAIKVSFVEIYNEDLIDLLGEQICGESKPQVMVREDSKGNILWSGLQEIRVHSVDEVGATDMNSQSSRSHAIFSVVMSQQKGSNASGSPMSPTNGNPRSFSRLSGSRPSSRSQMRMSSRDDVENMTVTSKFHFVDLAGSERLKRTSAIGDRAKEGISINSGLLALGNVISALGDPLKAKHTTHIPYRDSKLTRLLQDSLGGNAQTLMIACVSPTEYNLNETINTLKYANRARNIKNSAIVNQEETGWTDLEHLQSLVMKLRSEIKALKSANPNSENVYDDMYQSESGRSTPVHFQKGDGFKRSSLNTFTTASIKATLKHNKDIELLEEQLLDLQRSYSELSQKYAITTAELAMHQDNDAALLMKEHQLGVIKEEEEDSAEFRKAAEPVIEEYEKSISTLESQLALSHAALSHTETLMQDREGKLEFAVQINEQNINLINDFKKKISTLSERESTSEQYIKELEVRLEKYANQQKGDQELINELKGNIAHLKTSEANSECYITNLETRLESCDQQVEKFTQVVEKLEKRLQQRDEAYLELESKMKASYSEEEMKLLRDEIEERDHRILQLEKKVDDLVHELELLKRLKGKEGADESSNLISLIKMTNSSELSASKQEKLIILSLEEKLEELHKVHEQTVNEFNEIKDKYEGCLQEIHELQSQLTEVKLNHSDLFDSDPSSPMTPSTPLSNSVRMSLPPACIHKEGNKEALAFVNAMVASRQKTHRRVRSLAPEIIDKEKKDLTHEAIVKKLQNEIQQLESLHQDKAGGLEIFKHEFARLEMTHRETLEVVQELREEIKRRDALAQLEVMSVITSEGDISGVTSESDEHEIVHRLREEVENLREERSRILESISERENDVRKKGSQVVNLVSNIRELREQLFLALERDQKKSDEENEENKKFINELQIKVKDLEQQLEREQEEHLHCEVSNIVNEPNEEVDDEIIGLKSKAEKLQAEIEAKSHTIAVLLLPTVERDTIRKFENELHETKQAYHEALEISNSKQTSDELEQNVNENLKELGDKVKYLENQLSKAKESQCQTPRNSIKFTMDPQKTVEILQENLATLKQEICSKLDKAQHSINDQGLIAELQSQLEKLNSDIKEKYELIETLKKDLADKSVIQQKLRGKEAESSSLRLQLSEVKNRDEEMQNQIKQLQIELEKIETHKIDNEALKSELEGVRKELKISKEKESFAFERLKMLDAEETKIRQEMKRLRNIELLQKERITVLESRLSRNSYGLFDGDAARLKSELISAKETEMLQKKTISDLESKLEKSVMEYTSLQTKIDYIKSKALVNHNHILERENQLAKNEDSEKVKQLKEEIESLRAQETEQLEKIETLENQLSIMQKKNDVSTLKDELSSLKDIKSNFEKTIQDLEFKLSIAQKEAEKLQLVKDEIKLLKVLESEQKSTIDQLRAQLQEKTLAKDSVIKELDILKKDFGSQKELVVKLEGELKNVREELSIATEINDASSKKLEDLSKMLKVTLLERDTEEKKSKDLESKVEQLKISKIAEAKEITTLQDQLTKSKFEMEKQNELLAKLGEQMMNIEKEREQHALRIEELNETIKFKEAEQKEAVSTLESIIINLQMQLVETENSSQVDAKTIKRLGDQLATVETQLEKAKASDRKRAQIINEFEGKLKITNCTLNEKEQLLSTQVSLIQELEEIAVKTQMGLKDARKSEAIASKRAKELEVRLDEFQSKYEGNISSLNDNLNKIKNELREVRSSKVRQAELIETLKAQLQEAEIIRDREMSKLQKANVEIATLKEQCDQLKSQINDANTLQNYKNIDSSIVEDLTKQLETARAESITYRDRVEELENITKQLESDKKGQVKTNADLLQQVEQLQKKLESLTEEFLDSAAKQEDADMLSNDQKDRITDLENALAEVKKIKTNHSITFNEGITNQDDGSIKLSFAKLAEVNESLNKTNENLTTKILQAQIRMNALSQKIKQLESELLNIRLFEKNVSNDSVSNDGESVRDLKEKIRELEAEKEGLERNNSAFCEERIKLDQKIESLLRQLETAGNGGNGTASQLSELNNKIIELENEVSSLKQKSESDSAEMKGEISRLLEINEKLEKQCQKNEIKNHVKSVVQRSSSMPPHELEHISPKVKDRPRITSLDGSIQTKLSQQECTIIEQENIINTLKERIFELETRTDDESLYEVSLTSGMLATDLEAVGGFRLSTMSSNFSDIVKRKNMKPNAVAAIANLPITPPPTPPPSHSLLSSIGHGTISPPPRNANSPRPDSRTGFDFSNAQAAEFTVEIQKLHRRIAKMEGESLESKHLIDTLESSLTENETNLRVAKQQLQILQREKMDLSDQIKKLKLELDEMTNLYEDAKSSVQKEKQVIETVLEEERKAKECAEKARRQLETRMEELMAKKSKFMCF